MFSKKIFLNVFSFFHLIFKIWFRKQLYKYGKWTKIKHYIYKKKIENIENGSWYYDNLLEALNMERAE